MRIISKYKDYYDYLVGAKFGLDNKVVLDRTSGFSFKDYELKPHWGSFDMIKVAICGFLYYGIVDKDRNFYWGEKINPLGKWKKDWQGKKVFEMSINGRMNRDVKLEPVKTRINEEENCPIVFVSGVRDQLRSKYPCLKIFNMASIYPAERIYMDIYNWISKGSDLIHTDNRTDIEKLQSFGFDKKTSFRH